jgi:hypothetical protein
MSNISLVSADIELVVSDHNYFIEFRRMTSFKTIYTHPLIGFAYCNLLVQI